MLNFVYYPVSAILWFWHKVFGFVLGADNGFAWGLSVIFLVFTLRAVLYKPFVKQVRTQQQMQEFQPQIKALQKKYAGDRQRLAVEMQKLQKENGFNPIAGCLPVLLQAPVFIGLFHVLRSFNRTGGMASVPFLSPSEPMSAAANANTPNYLFGVDDVQSFLRADLFGAPLSSFITQPEAQLQAFADFGGIPDKVSIAVVAIPLMLIAAIATHFTARASVSRQSAAAAANPQAAIMNKLVLWIFPVGVLVGGPFLPVAILLYWLANNAWTLVQQHYVYAGIARADDEKREETQVRRAASAPKPGARPENPKKGKGRTSLAKPAADPAVHPVVEPVEPGREGDGGAPGPALDLTKGAAGGDSASMLPPPGGSAAPKGGRSQASRTARSGRPRSGAHPKTNPARGSRKKR